MGYFGEILNGFARRFGYKGQPDFSEEVKIWLNYPHKGADTVEVRGLLNSSRRAGLDAHILYALDFNNDTYLVLRGVSEIDSSVAAIPVFLAKNKNPGAVIYLCEANKKVRDALSVHLKGLIGKRIVILDHFPHKERHEGSSPKGLEDLVT